MNGTNVLSNITLATLHGPLQFTFTANTGDAIRVYRTVAGSSPGEMRVSVYGSNNAALMNEITPVTGTATTGGSTAIGACALTVPSPGGVSAGLSLWLDPSVTFAPNAWSSKGQDAATYNQGVASCQPSQQIGTMNFNNSIRFLNGGSQDLMTTAPGPIVTNDPSFESFITMKDLGSSAWSSAFGLYVNSHTRYDFDVASNQFQQVDVNSMGNDVTSIVPYSMTIPYIASGYVNYKNAGTFINGGYSSTISGSNYYCDRPLGSVSGICSRGNPQVDMAEIIIFERTLTAAERNRVQSYLGVKYGITLGVNGTSLDYFNSSNTNIKTQTNGYNFDVVGIGRDDRSGLSQLKSRSVNLIAGATFGGQRRDIITISNGNNFGSPNNFAADNSFLMVGNDNGALNNGGAAPLSILTDNGETIQAKMVRIWLTEETGTVGTVSIEADFSNPAVGAAAINDMSNIRMLVDEDGDFTTGATSIAPSSFNNGTKTAYFQHDFQGGSGIGRGYYFTFASTDWYATPLPIELAELDGKCIENENQLNWNTQSEHNNAQFNVQRLTENQTWETIGTIQGAGNSTQQSNYSFTDAKPQHEIEVYRIQQVDFDGTKRLSNPISIDRTTCFEGVKLFPNPASDLLTITSSKKQIGNIQVFDVSGRLLLEETITNSSTTLDVSTWSTGVYQINIDGKHHKVIIE